MRNQNVRLLGVDRLEVQLRDMGLDQVRKDQMRKGREFPRVAFFLIEDEVNDFAQARIGLFVIAL